jgi:tetratricopeptide (TPR) repeat protein
MSRKFYLALALAGLTGLPFVSADDQVFRKGGTPERGTITKMSKTDVTLTINSVERPIAANEILRITYEAEPSEMAGVRRDLAENNYKSALESLRKIDLGKIDRDVVKQEVEFSRALCMAQLAMREGGDKAAAEDALKDFAGKYRESYHFYQAAELAGDLAASAGKYADASRYYNAVVANVTWDDMRLRNTVALGRMLNGQGKYAEALQRFDAVVNDPVNTAETQPLKQQAVVGRAVCLAETGKSDEAIQSLIDAKGVISTNDPKDVKLMSRAYNALGNAYLKAGKKKEALLAFLHTDLLYFAEPDAHAEALYHLATLWTDVNKSDRSIEARNTLKQRYAGSVWASKN